MAAKETTERERTRTRSAHNERAEEEAEQRARAAASNLFDEAMDNYEQALKAGLRLQEESTKWWANLLNETTSPNSWHRAANALLTVEIWLLLLGISIKIS